MSQYRNETFENLLRELRPSVLGALVRRLGDLTTAEDGVQEALLAAAMQWPDEGIPDNPCGWLIQVACRRMTDQLRNESARRRRETEYVTLSRTDLQITPDPDIEELQSQDDVLILLFMSCHPSLTPSSAIALTLRAVGGLTTAEIANAFFVPESTMAQRISRAKRTIKESSIPFSMPTECEKAHRLGTVLHVLYLIFNEGYTSSIGSSLQRADLSGEAIRLARIIHKLLPHDSEVAALLALMLLTDARRPARTGDNGLLIPLAEQDRTLWDQQQISEGIRLIMEALPKGSIGPYQVQAAIAAIHDEAKRTEETDWPQILVLYEVLRRLSDNPMVTLNHAIAVAMVHGPSAGLERLSTLDSDERLAGHYRLSAVRAHLHELREDFRAAIANYIDAASRTTSIPERDYLNMRAARLTSK